MLVDADTSRITFRFITRTDSLVDSYSLFTSAARDVSVSVTFGWNLVSLPLSPIDPTPESIFPTAISDAYVFDTTGYHVADSLTPGRGYWIKFGSGQTIDVGGYPAFRIRIPVFGGWNLVGGPSTPVDGGDVITIPAGIVISHFFGLRGGLFRRRLPSARAMPTG